MTEAGKYRGIDPDGVLETEADHFMKCPGCGQWFGTRALDQVLANAHDAEIEIGEGPGAAKAGGAGAPGAEGEREMIGRQ